MKELKKINNLRVNNPTYKENIAVESRNQPGGLSNFTNKSERRKFNSYEYIRGKEILAIEYYPVHFPLFSFLPFHL